MRKMRNMGLDENLVGWTSNFMTERRVQMVVDGQEGDEMEVTTGLPQGSAVSPILFAIYIAEVHEFVESRVPGVRALSFVDDVTWLAVGEDVGLLVRTLERCARWSERWAKDNAVEFETSKTEAILFSRKRKHWKKRAEARIRVGEHTIKFSKEATRWLGIWLDSSLKLTTHRQKCINRARAAERRLRSLVGKFGTPPATARTLQTAIIQSTMLYGAELTWDGKRTHAQQYQLAINRMARSTLGALPSTPLGALINESALTPAEPLLDYRQARFAQRVLSAPEGSGTEDILQRRGTALTERLRTATHLREGDDVEAGYGEEGKKFQGAVVIMEGKSPKEAEEMAKAAALEWTDKRNTAWTDGSRLENQKVGCAVVWQEEVGDGTTPQTIQKAPSGARPRRQRERWMEDDILPPTPKWRKRGRHMGQTP